MDVKAIRQAMVSARAVLVTAWNEAEVNERCLRDQCGPRASVIDRNIRRLTAAIDELDKAAA